LGFIIKILIYPAFSFIPGKPITGFCLFARCCWC